MKGEDSSKAAGAARARRRRARQCITSASAYVLGGGASGETRQALQGTARAATGAWGKPAVGRPHCAPLLPCSSPSSGQAASDCTIASSSAASAASWRLSAARLSSTSKASSSLPLLDALRS
mgnify:CR=1 FL=1